MVPSIHPNGKPYEWDRIEGAKVLLYPALPAWSMDRVGGEGGSVALAEVPDITEKQGTGGG